MTSTPMLIATVILMAVRDLTNAATQYQRGADVAAHRLSTVTMADCIVVMDTGQVRAIGTHTQLLATAD